MQISISEKRALVTGGAGGIGRSIAYRDSLCVHI
jgi:NAD(P)-dependent dehydrogenase (short-subunit alcohol dehydrogenase family)